MCLSRRCVFFLLFACASLLVACQSAPRVRVETSGCEVRAGAREQAERISEAFSTLAPRLEALLPDSRLPKLSVWVQKLPTLYEFPRTTLPEADGFYAPDHRRIHLRENAPDLERTLAHEMTHAALGPSWSVLPGTIEEGLCDAVSAELVPDSRARLRAGRYCAAAFGMGGLRLDLVIRIDGSGCADGIARELSARVRFEGETSESIDPLSVFDAKAGSCSARLSTSRKKALYGCADLVIDRILERRGFQGLHRIAKTASQRGLTEIPRQWLLDAAGLSAEQESWQQALIEGLGEAELAELVRMQPMLLAEILVDFLQPLLGEAELESLLQATSMQLSAPQAGPAVELLTLPEFVRAVRARAGGSAALQERADS